MACRVEVDETYFPHQCGCGWLQNEDENGKREDGACPAAAHVLCVSVASVFGGTLGGITKYTLGWASVASEGISGRFGGFGLLAWTCLFRLSVLPYWTARLNTGMRPAAPCNLLRPSFFIQLLRSSWTASSLSLLRGCRPRGGWVWGRHRALLFVETMLPEHFLSDPHYV